MLLVTRVDGRRVFRLGVAGLVPAALVTLLLVHQPSIGTRRLYPMLRGSLALVGLGLALATLITWATAPNRLSRSSLSGLAWAAVTVLLCIGPFLESTPRARLYALELDTGDVVWATSRVAAAPVLVEGDADTADALVVTDVKSMSLVWLDPATGRILESHGVDEADDVPVVADAVAAGAYVPESDAPPPAPAGPSPASGLALVDGHVEAAGSGERSSQPLLAPQAEAVLAVARSGDSGYAYVSTAGADGAPGGSIVKFDVEGGAMLWRKSLPAVVAVTTGTPAIASDGDAVVVAGGERIGALDASDGDLRWTQSVVTLGKSRGYALPGAVQQVIIWDSLVLLSATPDH